MWARIVKFKNGRQTRGNGILLWACLLSFICGLIELGLPMEDMLRFARNELRLQKASGDIVIVGIDGRSLNEVKRWPWPREYHAQMIDTRNVFSLISLLMQIVIQLMIRRWLKP
jgi:CHASE2 domain-containing sensor protein